MEHSKSNRTGPFLGMAIAVLFLAPWGAQAAQPTFPSDPPPEEVCYCHNVDHNPHTVCTADRGFQMGHQNHVNNGIDTLGECPPSTERGCGDGVVRGREECDDGNTVTEECEYNVRECVVCAEDCTEQPGDTDFCGDGVVDGPPHENCDDGNTIPGDGCDSFCLIEVPFPGP